MEVKTYTAGGIEAVLSAPNGGGVLNVSREDQRMFWERFYGWARSYTLEGPLWFQVGAPVKELPWHEGGWAPRVEEVGPGVWMAHAVYMPGLYGKTPEQIENYGAIVPCGPNYKPTREEAEWEALRLASL